MSLLTYFDAVFTNFNFPESVDPSLDDVMADDGEELPGFDDIDPNFI